MHTWPEKITTVSINIIQYSCIETLLNILWRIYILTASNPLLKSSSFGDIYTSCSLRKFRNKYPHMWMTALTPYYTLNMLQKTIYITITGEDHNKSLMALYTCIMFACRYLHTHHLSHNGKRNAMWGRTTLDGLMFLHRPCSVNSFIPFDLHGAGPPPCKHQFRVVSKFVLTQKCGFETSMLKKVFFQRMRYLNTPFPCCQLYSLNRASVFWECSLHFI